MIDHGEITFRLRDVRMRRRMELFPNRERAKMRFLGFGETALVRVKDREIIQDRSDVGMLRAELFFINIERVQVIGLGRFLPPSLPINESDVVEDGAEIRIGNIRQPGAGFESRLVISQRSFGFTKVVANEAETPGGSKEGAIVDRLGFFQKRMGLNQVRLGRGPIAGLVVKLAEPLETLNVVRIAWLEGALRQG